MGKLIPSCFAANSDSVYFIAKAVNMTSYYSSSGELVALVKSDPYPVSIQKAKWTVVSTATSRRFSDWHSHNYGFNDMSCTVDDNGVFVFAGDYSDSGQVAYRYDPLTPTGLYYETLTKNNTGDWSPLTVGIDSSWFSTSTEFYSLFSVNGRNANDGTPSESLRGSNSTQFVAEYNFKSSMSHLDYRPSIEYAEFDSNGYKLHYHTANMTVTANGTVLSVRFGSEKLWAVMETGNPYYVPADNYTRPRHHRTLAVFPFTTPYNLTSPPASTVTTPWDLACEDSEIQISAVFGNKLYYGCRSDNGTFPAGHLYTYDSTTNRIQGPVDTDIFFTQRKSLTLVPGNPGSVSPAYGLVSTFTSFSVLDLSPENYGQCTNFDSLDNSMFLVDDRLESPSALCSDNCGQDTTTYAIFGGVFGSVSLILICWLLVVLCQQRRETKRQVVQDVVPESDEMALYLEEEQPFEPPPPYKRDRD
ncbi:hypothetical protein BGZ52_006988 [Haplosporangium bisporale]|nr:hypothetical protein BGZ52_006988 [Haplosporangium bisporale]KFH66891.1 hypothetical protein MVEG_07416 [Podila verticillata NRRL 6337]